MDNVGESKTTTRRFACGCVRHVWNNQLAGWQAACQNHLMAAVKSPIGKKTYSLLIHTIKKAEQCLMTQ
jgi:hypothetical protein